MISIRAFTTLLLREYWENRFFIFSPLIVCCLIAITSIVGILASYHETGSFQGIAINSLYYSNPLLHGISQNPGGNTAGQVLYFHLLEMIIWPILFCLTCSACMYASNSLSNERRDRSILFWKSMPVSDTATVLSKVFSAVIIAPLISAILATIAEALIIIVLVIRMWLAGDPLWHTFWQPSSFALIPYLNIALLLLSTFWLAPVLGWLWLVSSVIKRGTFLVAILIPSGLAFLEHILFQSHHLLHIAGEQLVHFRNAVFNLFQNESRFYSLPEPSFWYGIAICALFVILSIYFRRYRDDSY